jgi:hypothetical protein
MNAKAYRVEVEAHLIEQLWELVDGFDDVPARDLVVAFAHCAGAMLGELVRQWETGETEPGRRGPKPKPDIPWLLDEVGKQLREARHVGLANWSGTGVEG